jgi:fumarate reductase subunit C
VSANAVTTAKTPTARPRPPSGFPIGFYRYRNYILFAATSVFMALGGFALLEGLHALAKGEQAWNDWLAALAKPHFFALSLAIFGFTVYFAIRFFWVGRKIAVGRIGPIPGPPLPMFALGVLPIGGIVTVWLVLLVILSGAL